MAFVSITEAIKLSGVSRPTFYRKHIGDKAEQSQRVSVQVIDGRKTIDTSELERVFGSLNLTNETVSVTKDRDTTENNDLELKSLRLQLQEAKERESWYQQQIAEEKARAERAEVKLLEHIEPDKPEAQLQKEVAELRESIRRLSEPKWWQFWK